MRTEQAIDWDQLVSESHYRTISTIEELVRRFDNAEALVGLQHLYENMGKKDQREFRSFLILAMLHVLKWKHQPEKRSRSWMLTILYARDEMEDIREDVPSITPEFIERVWEKCFERAVRRAKDEMNWKGTFTPEPLTWQDVFEATYSLPND